MKHSNSNLEDPPRHNFLANYCNNCQKPSGSETCGAMFSQIIAPIQCPSILAATHRICPACLTLVSRDIDHSKHCLFIEAKYNLHAVGWSTPTSRHALQSLRRKNGVYNRAIVNLLCMALKPLSKANLLIIPIPIGSQLQSPWVALIQDVARSLGDVTVAPLLHRNKKHSTRNSSATTRAKIVSSEYSVEIEKSFQIHRRSVLLLDDNVTTGSTIIGCAELIKQHDPLEVQLFSIERYISPRILQRCSIDEEITCNEYINHRMFQ